MDATVRRGTLDDALAIAQLLHDFNREFDDPSPEPAVLAVRIRQLLPRPDFVVLLIGSGPDGIAVLRFRPHMWSHDLECYLAELYVVPSLRGKGLGRALMLEAIAVARAEGAVYMDLDTSETDLAARALYESVGFSNRERLPDGPLMYVYERDL